MKEKGVILDQEPKYGISALGTRNLKKEEAALQPSQADCFKMSLAGNTEYLENNAYNMQDSSFFASKSILKFYFIGEFLSITWHLHESQNNVSIKSSLCSNKDFMLTSLHFETVAYKKKIVLFVCLFFCDRVK